MAKRRLSHQQQQRIRQRQQQRRSRAARGDGDQDLTLGPERKGLVIAHYGAQLDVEALSEPEAGKIWRCHQRANLGETVTGDHVVWRAGADSGVIEAIEPRISLLQRPGFAGLLKPVAANIDRIVLVIAPEPEPFANLIDRYLVAAEHTEIPIVLLLNKSDLLPADPERRQSLEALLERYRSIGYPVLTASSRLEHGLDALTTELKGHTAVFVGQSGVGKSSLINSLIPGLETAVGALSAAETKGRHTTTTARLFHAPFGADIIDSPGIREFGLTHLEPTNVASGFREFRPWLGHCRFRDCNHQGEPGCALQQAFGDGKIQAERMASFEAILRELAEGP